MEQLYSYNSAAQLLDISVRTLKRLLEEQNLPVAYVGKRVRIQESVLNIIVVVVKPLETYNISI